MARQNQNETKLQTLARIIFAIINISRLCQPWPIQHPDHDGCEPRTGFTIRTSHGNNHGGFPGRNDPGHQVPQGIGESGAAVDQELVTDRIPDQRAALPDCQSDRGNKRKGFADGFVRQGRFRRKTEILQGICRALKFELIIHDRPDGWDGGTSPRACRRPALPSPESHCNRSAWVTVRRQATMTTAGTV